MSTVKEKIFGAITVMSDSDAEKVWEFILNNFPSRENEEETTDEFYKRLRSQIAETPDELKELLL